jgi:hypothetical protein
MNEEKRAALMEKYVLPIAAEIGFAFSLEELRQYEEEMVQASKNHELDDDELEAVAGGLGGAAGFCFLIGAGLGFALPAFCLAVGVGG